MQYVIPFYEFDRNSYFDSVKIAFLNTQLSEGMGRCSIKVHTLAKFPEHDKDCKQKRRMYRVSDDECTVNAKQ